MAMIFGAQPDPGQGNGWLFATFCVLVVALLAWAFIRRWRSIPADPHDAAQRVARAANRYTQEPSEKHMNVLLDRIDDWKEANR